MAGYSEAQAITLKKKDADAVKRLRAEERAIRAKADDIRIKADALLAASKDLAEAVRAAKRASHGSAFFSTACAMQTNMDNITRILGTIAVQAGGMVGNAKRERM